jgi:cell division protein FtsZ
MMESNYQFDLPSTHKSIIKVIGVGGGGSNAVNHMYNLGIKDVEFVVCNTDNQALESSPVKNKLQIGINLTGGLGAGANPEIGRNAAEESKEEIRELLSNGTKMLFITAGMGGGTGTGAAPVIAQVARELNILTVGIVTAPFSFEGKKKMQAANEGIDLLRTYCDTVLVIMNDKLREIFGNLSISEAFAQADNILNTAARGIAEIITVPGYVNVDFEDVKAVMKRAGKAVMGSAKTHGEDRARQAAEEALNSPLLSNQDVYGAERILLSIMSGQEAELQMDELTAITDYIQEYAGDNAELIFGHGIDPDLGENIRVTVIATGYSAESAAPEVMKEPYLKKVDPEIKPEEDNAHEADARVAEVEDDAHEIFEEEKLEEEDPGTITFDLSSFEKEEDAEVEPIVNESSKEPVLQTRLFSDENFERPEEEEEPLEEKSYEFNTIKEEIRKEIEEEEERQRSGLDFEFNIEGEYELEEIESMPQNDQKEELEDDELDELVEGPAIPISRKVQLMEERKRREEELARGKVELRAEDYKERLSVPAYERKKIQLKDVPHSSERSISRLSLNDDNQILGNNKFLHDNVD